MLGAQGDVRPRSSHAIGTHHYGGSADGERAQGVRAIRRDRPGGGISAEDRFAIGIGWGRPDHSASVLLNQARVGASISICQKSAFISPRCWSSSSTTCQMIVRRFALISKGVPFP